MTIKVHGNPLSTPTLRVLVALHEKQLDFEFELVNLRARDHKQESFLSLNPFGQVPALEDGDIKLFESRAITKYIAYTYENDGTPLIDRDKSQLASQLVWTEAEAHQFDPVGSKLAWELVHKVVVFKKETDMAIVEENEAKFVKVLDIYEARLTVSKYLGRDSFTLADLQHIPLLNYLIGTQVKTFFDERPHVSAWAKDILARPAWVKTLALQRSLRL